MGLWSWNGPYIYHIRMSTIYCVYFVWQHNFPIGKEARIFEMVHPQTPEEWQTAREHKQFSNGWKLRFELLFARHKQFVCSRWVQHTLFDRMRIGCAHSSHAKPGKRVGVAIGAQLNVMRNVEFRSMRGYRRCRRQQKPSKFPLQNRFNIRIPYSADIYHFHPLCSCICSSLQSTTFIFLIHERNQ